MFHNHSIYSALDSTNRIPKMVERAKQFGLPALGLSDHGTTSGLFEFHKECTKQGIKPVLGCELYFTPNVSIKDRSLHYHLCVFAKNKTGYNNLLRLVTTAHQNFFHVPRVDFNILREADTTGLVFTSACMGGIMRDNMEIFNELSSFLDIYAEMHTYDSTEQKEFNRLLVRNVVPERIIVATDAHYTGPEDADIHRQWMKLAGKDQYYQGSNLYIMGLQEMHESISEQAFASQIIDNSLRLAESFETYDIVPSGKHYPVFPIANQKAHLEDLCYPLTSNDDEVERVAHEIAVLEKTDYINYILILKDIFDFCRSQGIRTGCGRGSVVASLVANLTGITKINPLDYDLVFERFAHTERVSSPDIDTDVSSRRRGEVIEYLKNKYGKVHQVRTFNFTAMKGAVQRAGQALALPPKDIDEITKSMTSFSEIKDSNLRKLSEDFEGLLQNYGVHAAAIVIFPDDTANYTALERVLDKDGNETFVTAYDYYALEEMGLLKLDLLGVDVLDAIEDTLNLIGDDNLREMVDEASLPDSDTKTFLMINNRATDGCFQIETEGMKSTILKTKPKKVTDIVDLVALYRPGPKDAGMIDVYATGRSTGNIKYLHPKLEPILSHTNGIILYQEQIQQICRELCGYTFGQGDILRRIVGKKKIEEMKPALEKLIADGVKNGISVEIMQNIADQIETFGSYGFNKGHSVAYGYTAYITAYLKAHYPREFWCGVLNTCLGDTAQTAKYVHCAKKDGITVLPPSIMDSNFYWTIKEGNLLMGFACIKGIKHEVDIVRKTDLVSFLMVNKMLNKRIVEGLIKSGCFGSTVTLNLQMLYKDRAKTKKEQAMTLVEYCSQNPLPQITLGSAQLEVIGIPFEDVFAKFDKSFVNGRTNRIGICTKVKRKTDKNGKPMAWISFNEPNGLNEYVMFWRGYRELTEGVCYIFKVNEGRIIQDVTEARVLTR